MLYPRYCVWRGHHRSGSAVREGCTSELDPWEMEKRLRKFKNDMIGTMEHAFKNRYLQRSKLTLISPRLAKDMVDRDGVQRSFCGALAVCHNVLPDRPDAQNDPWKEAYKAESPDEAALVAAAWDVGFPFLARTKDGIDIGAIISLVPVSASLGSNPSPPRNP